MPEIYRHPNRVTRRERFSLLGESGAVVWFTGLSGSGKSTVASIAERALIAAGRRAYLLDGDNLRFGLNGDLDFSDAGRRENIRRIAHVAALFADSGAVALVSAISPFESDRANAKAVCAAINLPFIEVFVDAALETCAARDVKGLYKKAFAGEIDRFTGVSSPYEPPADPDVVLRTGESTPDESAAEVLAYLDMLGTLRGMAVSLCGAAVEAGRKIMEIYESDFTVTQKDDKSPLTQADLASDHIITGVLSARYPSHAILSEESRGDLSRLQNPGCFIVDPLDGTKEFIKRNGEFTVNIAFAYKGKSVLGVVYVPASGTLYYAAKGLGAYAQSGADPVCFADENRIHVSVKTDALTVMTSRSHGDDALDALLARNAHKIGATVSAGSSLKGCLIAEGRADVYYRPGLTMEWDTAAMQCVVEEAGGVFRQSDGSPMRYNRADSLNDKGFFILNRAENRFS